jgi:mRNA-degrading endonuclease RelE of RelBE toxin-antitoxin system
MKYSVAFSREAAAGLSRLDKQVANGFWTGLSG